MQMFNSKMNKHIVVNSQGFPGGSMVKKKNHLPMQETWVPSLGWEDPLEKDMTAHSSILAWEIPYRAEPGGLQSMESLKVWRQLTH